MSKYAVLGATGNCGTALIENLLNSSSVTEVRAFCRNREKLSRIIPRATSDLRVKVFEGATSDSEVLEVCIQSCYAVFLCITTNDNIPGCHLGQDTALAVIRALEKVRAGKTSPIPKLVLLSSATIDDVLSRNTPAVLRSILLMSASHVYNDLQVTEKHLRAQQDWLTTIYIKPGALSVDIQRGHALSLTDEESPVSYLDLAAGMIEAVNDPEGKYDQRNVGVLNTNGRAKFPSGTPLCIAMGLLRHFAPFLHPYLPSGTGPR